MSKFNGFCVGAEFQNVPGIDSILCVEEIEN
jgi:hypothetical protein